MFKYYYQPTPVLLGYCVSYYPFSTRLKIDCFLPLPYFWLFKIEHRNLLSIAVTTYMNAKVRWNKSLVHSYMFFSYMVFIYILYILNRHIINTFFYIKAFLFSYNVS